MDIDHTSKIDMDKCVACLKKADYYMNLLCQLFEKLEIDMGKCEALFKKAHISLEKCRQLLVDAQIQDQYFSKESRNVGFHVCRMCKGQTPEMLAVAGFFQTEYGAQVQYYECGIRVHKGNLCSDSFEEHYRMNLNCQLVETEESTIEIAERVELYPSGEGTGLNNILKTSPSVIGACSPRHQWQEHGYEDLQKPLTPEKNAYPLSKMSNANTFDKSKKRCLTEVHSSCYKVCSSMERSMTIVNGQIIQSSIRSLDFKTTNKDTLFSFGAIFQQSTNKGRCRLCDYQFSFKKTPRVLTEVITQDWKVFVVRTFQNNLLLQTSFGLLLHLFNGGFRQSDVEDLCEIIVS